MQEAGVVAVDEKDDETTNDVKRENYIPIDGNYGGGLAAADWGLRQREAGRWLVFTPHSQAQLTKRPLLLSGKDRPEADVRRFEEKWGRDLHDPCYSERFSKKKANYGF